MRYLAFLLLPLALGAQPAESDQRLTQALITEIQQLRLAIERSTLLGARTQLAISQLQLQETAAARLNQQYSDVRQGDSAMSTRRKRTEEKIQDLEQAATTPEFANPQKRGELGDQIKELKLQLEEATATEQQHSARESELAQQLQAAQNQMADSRNRIAEIERGLDAAIQELLKAK